MRAALFRQAKHLCVVRGASIVAVGLVGGAVLLGGCGQRGPLFLPKLTPDGPVRTSSAPAPNTVAPGMQSHTIPEIPTENSGPFINPVTPAAPADPNAPVTPPTP